MAATPAAEPMMRIEPPVPALDFGEGFALGSAVGDVEGGGGGAAAGGSDCFHRLVERRGRPARQHDMRAGLGEAPGDF